MNIDVKTLSLDDAITQQITLGFADPSEIAERLEDLHGQEWVASQLVLYRHDILADLARKRLGVVRRSAELALRPGDQMASAEMKIAKSWVPGGGWKPVADLTEADLSAKATWYRSLAVAAVRRAAWCEEVIELMRAEGIRTIGKLKAALPPLPPEEGLALDA